MIITTAIDKIEALQKRIKIIQGGTSAGKTYSVLAVLITKAASYARTEISIVAESIPHLRRGALKDFLKIMKENNRYFDERFNKSLLRYEFSNGSVRGGSAINIKSGVAPTTSAIRISTFFGSLEILDDATQ